MTDAAQLTSAADAFRLLWDQVSDLVGSSATATLVRRAAKYGARTAPALAELEISKRTFEYELGVPERWSMADLAALVAALEPLLVELTGKIVTHRLRSIPALADLFVEDGHE